MPPSQAAMCSALAIAAPSPPPPFPAHLEPRPSFDFIIAPLAHPRQRRTFSRGQCTRPGAFTRSDLVLSSDGVCVCV